MKTRVINRATGQEVPQRALTVEEMEDGPERIARARDRARNDKWKAIDARVAKQEAAAESFNTHDKALEHFKYANPDVSEDPNLLRRFLEERKVRVEQYAQNGQAVQDWRREYADIANHVRVKAGYETAEEQDRKAHLAAERRARGQE